jgi:hypothetical protein
MNWGGGTGLEHLALTPLSYRHAILPRLLPIIKGEIFVLIPRVPAARFFARREEKQILRSGWHFEVAVILIPHPREQRTEENLLWVAALSPLCDLLEPARQKCECVIYWARKAGECASVAPDGSTSYPVGSTQTLRSSARGFHGHGW